ncbi:MAG: ATP-binding cassette domain-containing protein [Solirubrobacterales bacterium]|nr:ATP-binding cassette domain-containing protein [Solirubrobacterales bacterium]
MTLLALSNVTKRYATRRREHVALRNVSLEIAAGELVSVWGMRHSGRTTLLRVAAGIEAPDDGTVRFDGRILTAGDSLLGTEIGYTNLNFMATQGSSVVDQVAVSLLARGCALDKARSSAFDTLERVGAADCADLDVRTLDPAEQMRVAIARALISKPRLLLVDEPTNGVDILQRDPLLALIRSIADTGTAILLTVGEVVNVADRALSIDEGELRGEVVPEGADVLPLRLTQAQSSA